MSDNSSGAKLRATAAQVVDDVIARGHSLDRALAENAQRIAARDHALLRNLSYGTLRFHWQLQATINELLSRPLKKRDSIINQLLAVGLYQLSDTRIPDHAVVSETVEATRQLRGESTSQVDDAKLAVAHGNGGMLASIHTGGTVVLAKD